MDRVMDASLIANPKMALALLILIASAVTDLKSKKIPNRLILIGGVLALLLSLALDGRSWLWPTFASLATAATFTFPLYSLRAIGAGDVKLIMILALLMNWSLVINMILAAMVWGSLLGIFRVIVAGKARAFIGNILMILQRQKPQASSLSYIPFSIAIVFGFLTSVSLAGAGVSWL